MNRENFVQLEGDAVVAFTEYGDPHGEPVIFCHGWPSSRTMAELTDVAAYDLHVRVASPDRPGIADSTYMPGRRLLDWPPLVRAPTDLLCIEQFRRVGIA